MANTDGGVLLISRDSTVVISDCEFSHNTAYRSGGVLYLSDSVINLKSITFTHNAVLIRDSGVPDASASNKNGGVMNVIDTNVTVNHCTFVSNAAHGDGGVMESEDSTINISNSALSNNTGSHVGGVFKSRSSTTVIDSGVLSDDGSSRLMIYNSSFDNNVANNQGGIIGYYHTHLSMVTCSLNSNMIFSLNDAFVGGGVIHGITSTLNSLGFLVIRQNRGNIGIVNMEMSRATFGGFLTFERNYRSFFILRSTVVFSGESVFMNNTRYPLNNTSEFSEGGALTVYHSTAFGTFSQECFIQTLALYSSSSHNLNTVNTYFFNNVARVSGSALYGGLLDRCTVNPSAEIFHKNENITLLDGVTYIQNVTNINLSSIASDPVRLCFCKNGQPDCSYQPHTVYINSEGNSTLSVVAVDQMNTAIPATITSYLTFLRPGEEFSQNVTDRCTNLDSSFLQSSARLLLFPDGPCNNLGISQHCFPFVLLSNRVSTINIGSRLCMHM